MGATPTITEGPTPHPIFVLHYQYREGSVSGSTTEVFTAPGELERRVVKLWRKTLGNPQRIPRIVAHKLVQVLDDPETGDALYAWEPLAITWPAAPTVER